MDKYVSRENYHYRFDLIYYILFEEIYTGYKTQLS